MGSTNVIIETPEAMAKRLLRAPAQDRPYAATAFKDGAIMAIRARDAVRAFAARLRGVNNKSTPCPSAGAEGEQS